MCMCMWCDAQLERGGGTGGTGGTTIKIGSATKQPASGDAWAGREMTQTTVGGDRKKGGGGTSAARRVTGACVPRWWWVGLR